MGYNLNGLGMATPTRRHKEISRNIVINFYLRFGFDKYDIYQEAAADQSDHNGLVPDPIIYQNRAKKPVTMFEIDHTKALWRADVKIGPYLDHYGVREVFVYD